MSCSEPDVLIKRLDPGVPLPSYAHPGDAGADLTTVGENQYRFKNSVSGLEVTLTADFENRNVRYSYSAINERSAGVPEGGILSMRQSRRGAVEFYSADERLTSEETRQVLLEPLLFPKQSAA